MTGIKHYLVFTGHFALDAHGQDTADLICEFLNRMVDNTSLAAN